MFSMAMLKVLVVVENLLTLNIMLNSVNPKGCTTSLYQIYYCVVVVFLIICQLHRTNKELHCCPAWCYAAC